MARIQLEIANDTEWCCGCIYQHGAPYPFATEGPRCRAFPGAGPMERDGDGNAVRCQACLNAEVREPIKLTERGGL